MKPPTRSPIPRKIDPKPVDPDELVADVLGFLATDPDRLSRFMDLTGLTPQTLRRAAALPGFSASVLGYLASDERLLLAFAADRARNPAEIAAVCQSLVTPQGDGE